MAVSERVKEMMQIGMIRKYQKPVKWWFSILLDLNFASVLIHFLDIHSSWMTCGL